MIEIRNRKTGRLLYTVYARTLEGVDLRGAELFRADLAGANLRGARLCGADLREANLAGADLTDAELRDVMLYETVLTGARLQGADLRRADLRRTRLANADLTGVLLEVGWEDRRRRGRAGSVNPRSSAAANRASRGETVRRGRNPVPEGEYSV